MNLSRAMIVLLSFASLVLCDGTTADASVRGRRFVGGFITNLGFPAVCSLTFDQNGQLTLWEYGVLFGGTYSGSYTETGPEHLKSWLSIVPDESPNGTARLSGFCPFGLLTTYHNQNLDQLITANGLLIFAGFVP